MTCSTDITYCITIAPPETNWSYSTCSGWTQNSACAKGGAFGLRRVADGVFGTSATNSTNPIAVTAGQTLYLEESVKTINAANGLIRFQMNFYDASGVYLSSAGVDSVGAPSDWATFSGSITVPANAVMAIPSVVAVGHTTGTWCVNALFSQALDEHFILSSIKSYFDNYSSYR